MNASSRDRLGDVPGVGGVTADALREKHRRSREAAREGDAGSTDDHPPTDEDASTGDSRSTGDRPSTDDRPPARTRPPARRKPRAPEEPPGAPQGGSDGRTDDGQRNDPGEVVWPSPATMRQLEITGRSYAKGWVRVEPRADRLTAAVLAALAEGTPPSQIRGFLTQYGVKPNSLPLDVEKALRKL